MPLWVGAWVAVEVPGSCVKVSGRKWSPEHTAAASTLPAVTSPMVCLCNGLQKVHCAEVSKERKKPVSALGEIRELNFLSLFPRAEKFFHSNADLGFHFGLTQAIHTHATVPGSCQTHVWVMHVCMGQEEQH